MRVKTIVQLHSGGARDSERSDSSPSTDAGQSREWSTGNRHPNSTINDVIAMLNHLPSNDCADGE